jgi:hypothetical protein
MSTMLGVHDSRDAQTKSPNKTLHWHAHTLNPLLLNLAYCLAFMIMTSYHGLL